MVGSILVRFVKDQDEQALIIFDSGYQQEINLSNTIRKTLNNFNKMKSLNWKGYYQKQCFVLYFPCLWVHFASINSTTGQLSTQHQNPCVAMNLITWYSLSDQSPRVWEWKCSKSNLDLFIALTFPNLSAFSQKTNIDFPGETFSRLWLCQS